MIEKEAITLMLILSLVCNNIVKMIYKSLFLYSKNKLMNSILDRFLKFPEGMEYLIYNFQASLHLNYLYMYRTTPTNDQVFGIYLK